jgi:hypothetical protein
MRIIRHLFFTAAVVAGALCTQAATAAESDEMTLSSTHLRKLSSNDGTQFNSDEMNGINRKLRRVCGVGCDITMSST